MTSAEDASGVRNFKDFLLQYNKMTEHCFTKCASNFNYRTLTDIETNCVESCSNKALVVNQKVMQTFVVLQAKRQEAMVEDFTKQQEATQKRTAEAFKSGPIPEGTVPAVNTVENGTTDGNISVENMNLSAIDASEELSAKES